MPTSNFSIGGGIGSWSFQGVLPITSTAEERHEATCNVAKAGTLTTRTNNTQGVVTLASGHGQTTGTFDLYWAGGSRYGVSGTVSGDTITLSSGAGDNLPSQGEDVVVCKIVTLDLDVLHSGVQLAIVYSLARCSVAFYGTDGVTLLKRVECNPAGSPWVWYAALGSNPFSSAIGDARVSAMDTTGAAKVNIGLAFNAQS